MPNTELCLHPQSQGCQQEQRGLSLAEGSAGPVCLWGGSWQRSPLPSHRQGQAAPLSKECFGTKALRSGAFLSSQPWCFPKWQVLCGWKGSSASSWHGLTTATAGESPPSRAFILCEQRLKGQGPDPTEQRLIPPPSKRSGR